jgi:siroheme synthase
MSVANLERIAAELIDHGRDPREPAAVIEWATTPRQRTIRRPLEDIAAEARAQRIEAPSVLVVGPTAALARQISDVKVLVGAARG